MPWHVSPMALTPLGELIAREVARLEAGPEAPDCVPSGFRDLDVIIGGFTAGELTIVAGPPEIGTNTFLVDVADHARQGGRAVGFFSLSMSEGEIARRFISRRARIDGDDLRKRRLSANRWRRIVERAAVASDSIVVETGPLLDAGQVAERARAMQAKLVADGRSLDLLLVDSLDRVRPVDTCRWYGHEVAGDLKELADELSIPVLVSCGVSSDAHRRADRWPSLSDLDGYGPIERLADLVLLLHRDDYYDRLSDRVGEADVVVAKNTRGPLAVAALQFFARYPRFADRYP